MFYFLFSSFLTYNFVLIAAAVIPAVFLMVKVYQSDRLDKESPEMLRSLILAGIISSLIALVAERILSAILDATVSDMGTYMFILYFGIVAFSEEGAKYFMLRRRSWDSDEFNCLFDGIVYSVFVSLGFALWENISYVMHYGFATALVRAVTAIPGHACFGVFMGVFYGIAKMCDNAGDREKATTYKLLSIVIPALLHGTYDYIASTQATVWLFILFIIILFVISYYMVSRVSENDRYIG